MKNTIDKLNDFIDNFVLENNLDTISDSEFQKSAKTSGVMLDTLNKLVTLIQSNIIKCEEDDEYEISESHEEIIKRFLEKNGYCDEGEVKKIWE